MSEHRQFFMVAGGRTLSIYSGVPLLRRLSTLSMLGLMLINPLTASATAGSEVKILTTTQVISDSISNSNPKALPGAVVEFQAQVSYSGQQALDTDSLAITNAVPPAMSLVVADSGADNSGSFVFIEGAQPSDLSCDFQSLADNSDCVEFSSDGGISFDYKPTPDFAGIDPAITHLRFRLRGAMAPASPEPSYFILKYRMRVD